MNYLIHKTPSELRAEIAYQERAIGGLDLEVTRGERRLADLKADVQADEDALGLRSMARNNHHQRLVWAKNYLMMKE